MMNRDNGFTLVEVVVAVFVVGIVVAMSASMFVFYFRNFNFTFEQGRTVSQSQVAMGRVLADIREARTSEDGAYPLAIANDQEIEFYSDIDNDDKVERVRYFLTGNVFQKGVVEPGSPPLVYDPNSEEIEEITSFVRNGVNPIFYYFNSDWPGDEVNNPLEQSKRLLETRLVRVELLLNTDPDQQSDFTVSTEVMVRNLKTN
jgi:prepilin-type N-terminal cleavage/methylation domain-containing protein